MTRVGKLGRVLSFAALLTGLSQLPACELTVDTAPLSNGVCPANQKPCKVQGKDACVPQDKDHGCGSTNCTSCIGQLANVQEAACSGGAFGGTCVHLTCSGPFLDCNLMEFDGCEVDTRVGTPVSGNSADGVLHCGNCVRSYTTSSGSRPTGRTELQRTRVGRSAGADSTLGLRDRQAARGCVTSGFAGMGCSRRLHFDCRWTHGEGLARASTTIT